MAADLVPTFLAAHAVPPEYKERPEAYVDLVVGPGQIGRSEHPLPQEARVRTSQNGAQVHSIELPVHELRDRVHEGRLARARWSADQQSNAMQHRGSVLDVQ